MPKELPRSEVLCYNSGKSQATVRRHYLKWRTEQNPPIPERCDNPECILFSSSPPVWNGKKLNLILDHIDGAHKNNSPKNLRLLCPNCNSQLETHGGGNKDRIEYSEGGYARKRKDGSGKKDYKMPIKPAAPIEVSGGVVGMKWTKKPQEDNKGK